MHGVLEGDAHPDKPLPDANGNADIPHPVAEYSGELIGGQRGEDPRPNRILPLLLSLERPALLVNGHDQDRPALLFQPTVRTNDRGLPGIAGALCGLLPLSRGCDVLPHLGHTGYVGIGKTDDVSRIRGTWG